MKGGLILEHVKPKDYTQEKLFGSADRTEKIVPLGRDVSAVPQIYQGDRPVCVAATITWIKQFMSGNIDLAHEYLAMIAKIGSNGAKPSQVLEPARKRGIASQNAWDEAETSDSLILEQSAEEFKVHGYTRITDLSMHGIYTALKRSPLAVGVSDWKGVGPHFMAVYDVTEDGLACKARNWWEGSEEEVIPFDKIVCAYGFLSPEFSKPSHPINAGWVSAIASFLAFNKKLLGLGGIILASLLALLNPIGFGAGYTPVTGYESTFTARVTASDATFPVASINDKAGHAIVFANTSPSSTARIYFTLEPGGTREEVSYCTGVSGSTFTGCVRGLDFQGGGLTASSTLAKVHPAGSKLIISNVGQVYGEFVSIDGTQRIDGAKYFAVIPRQTTTTTLPTANDQYATKYYVDSVGAGGLTSANVSSTMGLIANGTAPETFGVRLSSLTSGLWFDTGNSYALSIKTSSTKGLYIDSLGNVAIDESDNFVWGGTHTFNGNVTTTGKLQVATPTADADAVSLGYLNTALTDYVYPKGSLFTSTYTTGSRNLVADVSSGSYYYSGYDAVSTYAIADGATAMYTSIVRPMTTIKYGFARSFLAGGVVTLANAFGSNSNERINFGVGTSTFTSKKFSYIANYAGFEIRTTGAGTGDIYAYTTNGSASTTSYLLTTLVPTDVLEWGIDFSPTSTCAFTLIKNGATAITTSTATNLPTGEGAYLGISHYKVNATGLSANLGTGVSNEYLHFK